MMTESKDWQYLDEKHERHTHDVSHPLYSYRIAVSKFLEAISTGIPQLQAVTSIISLIRRLRPRRVSCASIVNSVWLTDSNCEALVRSIVNREQSQLPVIALHRLKLTISGTMTHNRFLLRVRQSLEASCCGINIHRRLDPWYFCEPWGGAQQNHCHHLPHLLRQNRIRIKGPQGS